MKKLTISLLLLIFTTVTSNDCDNGNKEKQNSTSSLSWSFGVSNGLSLPSSSGEKDGFQGNGQVTAVFGRVFSGNVGFSVSSSFLSSSFNKTALDNFAADSFYNLRKIPENDRLVKTTSPTSTFWAVGPSVKLGERVSVILDLSVGLIQNNPGTISIETRENIRADGTVSPKQTFFVQEQSEKKYFPLFGGGLSIEYPIANSVSLSLSGNYGKATPMLYKRVSSLGSENPVERKAEQNFSQSTISVGLSKFFGSERCEIDNAAIENQKRERGSGIASGKRTYSPAITNRDHTSGLPTGRRTYSPFVSPRDAASGLPTGKRTYYPVASSGSSMSSGGRFTGRVHLSSFASSKIVNNTSNTDNISAPSTVAERGVVTSLFIRSSDKGSGLATGRRQYSPLLLPSSSSGEVAGVARISSNPLYNGSGNEGASPLYQEKRASSGIDNDCDGISGLHVDLVDRASGEIVSSTVTEACGTFWFDNVPQGEFVVSVVGIFASKKGYDYYQAQSGKLDLAGRLNVASSSVKISAATDTIISSSTGAVKNESSTRQIWSTRSNAALYCPVDDIDGDAIPDLMLIDSPENVLRSSSSSNGYAHDLFRSSSPYSGGEVILLQKGKEVDRVRCDENGQFEFAGLEKGQYTIVTGGAVYVACSFPVTVVSGK